MSFQASVDDPDWLTLVKTGSLDKAFELYNSVCGLRKFMFRLFPRHLVPIFVQFFLLPILRRKPRYNDGYTSANLAEALLYFWRSTDQVGPVLIIQIVRQYLRDRTIPLRATTWLVLWLTMQGRYQIAIQLLAVLRNPVQSQPKIQVELLSFFGNYFFIRGKLKVAEKYFNRVHRQATALNNDFIAMFNLSQWVMVPAHLGELGKLEEILSVFDSLKADQPDERAGLRLLSISAYLQMKVGNPELGNRFWHSATHVFERCGSALDRALYYLFKSLIDVLAGDNEGALNDIKMAKKEMAKFGTYNYYTDLLECLELKFSGKDISRQNMKRRFRFHRGIWPLLAAQTRSAGVKREATSSSWFRRYFEFVLPQFDEPEKLEREQILELLKEQSCATRIKYSIQPLSGPWEPINQISLRSSTAKFKLNFIHRGEVCFIELESPFLPWRNRDLFVSLKTMIFTLHNSSFRNHYQRQEAERRASTELAGLARQVAHDIRSPLSALAIAVGKLEQNPTDSISLIKSSITRINGIASDLLKESLTIQTKGSLLVGRPNLSLDESLHALIAEKRLEFLNRPEVEIFYVSDSRNVKVASHIQIDRLQTLLSNLINNAVESFSGSGVVTVHSLITPTRLKVSVRDTGKGIPQPILERLQRGEALSTKADGNGLGLSGARRVLLEMCGELKIISDLDHGTTMNFEVPL